MKKHLSLGLALLLLLGCGAGCGSGGSSGDSASAPDLSAGDTVESAAPEETGEGTETGETPEAGDDLSGTEEETAGPALELDYDLGLSKYDPETVVMTVNEVPVHWADYYSELFQYASTFNNYYGVSDFSMEIDEDETVSDYLNEIVRDYWTQVILIHQKADELGLQLTEADQTEIQENLQSYADFYASGDVDQFLESSHMSLEMFTYLEETSKLVDALIADQFGEDGSAIPEGDVLAYAEDHGLMYAKHILLKTVDDNREPLDEETIASQREKAEELLEQLRNTGPDALEETFDELMNTWSEDTGGLLSFPDGYCFPEGTMMAEFEEAAKNLEEGQLSEIVETAYGYHILYRPALYPEVLVFDSSDTPHTLRYVVADSLFGQMYNEWFETMDVVYTPEFENLDVNELFLTDAGETNDTDE